MSKSHFFLTFFSLLLATVGMAAVPTLVNYQGRLTDTNGVPLTGSVAVDVALFAEAAGGVPLYSETIGNTELGANGVYSFAFGGEAGFSEALASGSAIWLEVIIDRVALSPRERVLAVPYALHAASVAPGSIGQEALATPYQTGEVAIHTLTSQGATFFLNERVIELAVNFSPAFGAPPFLTSNLTFAEPLATLGSSVQVMQSNPADALLRLTVPLVHQGTGVSIGRHGAAMVQGTPAVAGRAGTDLVFARAADAFGQNWQDPVNVGPTSVTTRIALAVIGDRPAIAYSTSNSSALFFVRANDSAGATWGTPETVVTAAAGASLTILHLADVNGRPAITYESNSFDQEFGETTLMARYIVASNTTGTSWESPFTLFNDFYSGLGFSTQAKIIIADTLPAVVYQSPTGFQIRRASNIFGTSWGAPVEVENLPFDHVTRAFDAGIISGNPAVAYAHPDSPSLRFKRAMDNLGSSWPGVYRSLHSGAVTVNSVALAEVSGSPAVAFVEAGFSGPFFYRRASNSDGSSWLSTSPDLRNSAHSGGAVSLLSVEGEPAILYGDRYLRSGQLPVGILRWFAVGP